MVGSLVEGELGFHTPAVRALFRAGMPAVDDMQSRARADGLVFELPAELRERRVRDGFGEPVVFDHAGHVQVLDADVRIRGCEHRGELVQHVATLVGDAGVETGDPSARLAAAVRAFLFAAQRPGRARPTLGSRFARTVTGPLPRTGGTA